MNTSLGDYVDGTDGDYSVDPLFEEDAATYPNFTNGLMYDQPSFSLKEQGGGVSVIPGYFEYLLRAKTTAGDPNEHASLI